ncbi:MAG: hypothetical protein Q7T82_01705 [Armatimonadota bacterium]|nr:hypothetical protein [Armatimonadota bacterium]
MNGKEIRNAESQRAHDDVVKLIAGSRFNVGDWSVVVDAAAEAEAVRDDGDPVCADIIAKVGDEIIALGEVETKESVSDEEAAQWLELGRLCSRLYLFVPEGTERTAAELIAKHGVRCAGLRAYAIGENKTISVESVSISNGHSRWNDHAWWMSIGKN